MAVEANTEQYFASDAGSSVFDNIWGTEDMKRANLRVEYESLEDIYLAQALSLSGASHVFIIKTQLSECELGGKWISSSTVPRCPCFYCMTTALIVFLL